MVFRRCIAALLLVVFGLPLFASAVSMGQDPENALPACCRRNGAHHCAMSMGQRAAVSAGQAASATPRFEAPLACCPYCPASPVASHVNVLGTPVESTAVLLQFHTQPAVVAQTEARWRIAREGARQKRGPPKVLSY